MEKITEFEELPNEIKIRIKRLMPNDFSKWVKVSIPALENKSILETISSENGYAKVVQYLINLEGKFY